MPLRLLDFSDRDLLDAVVDCLDSDGYTTAQDVADFLNLQVRDPGRSVAIRFSWLKRYGMMEKGEGKLWTLTPEGEALVTANLRKPTVESLLKLPEESLWALTDLLGQRFQVSKEEAQHMIRRQFTFGTARR